MKTITVDLPDEAITGDGETMVSTTVELTVAEFRELVVEVRETVDADARVEWYYTGSNVATLRYTDEHGSRVSVKGPALDKEPVPKPTAEERLGLANA